MSKEYLDYLYELKMSANEDVERFRGLANSPTAQCCENMDNVNRYLIMCDLKRAELERIDTIIDKYINIK